MSQFRILLFLITGLSGAFLHAQSFTYLYGSGASLGRMTPTPDGGYLMVGNKLAVDFYHSSGYLVKTDENGLLQWSYTFAENGFERLTDAVVRDDGSYLVVGMTQLASSAPRSILMLNFEPTGDLLWIKRIYSLTTEESEDPTRIISLGNDEYLLIGMRVWGVGTGYDVNDLAIKTTGNGDVLWSSEFGFQVIQPFDIEVAWDVISMSDGGYLLAGSRNSIAPHLQLVRLDSSGAFMWDRTYEEITGGFTLRASGNDLFLLASISGDVLLMKLDAGAEPVWCKRYEHTSILVGVTLEILDNGDLILGARSTTTGTQARSAIIRLNDAGVPISASLHGIMDDAMSIRSIHALASGDLVAAFSNVWGSSDTTKNFGLARLIANMEGYDSACEHEPIDIVVSDMVPPQFISVMSQLAEFDLVTSDHNWIPEVVVGQVMACITTDLEEEVMRPSAIVIYPNPATTGFWIDGMEHGSLDIQIMDVMGRQVLWSTSTDRYVALPALTTGVYYCLILDQSGAIGSVKLLVD